jgi:hypothetical protein
MDTAIRLKPTIKSKEQGADRGQKRSKREADQDKNKIVSKQHKSFKKTIIDYSVKNS